MGIRIRKAKDSELGLIKKMSVGELRGELSEYEKQFAREAETVFAERISSIIGREANEFYVAEDGNQMVGYFWFGVSQTPFGGMKIGWIYDIQVLTSHRGRGVGEALMKRALDLSKSNGFQVAGLMVNAKNAVAMSLYGKLGFQTGYMIMFRQETNATPTSDG